MKEIRLIIDAYKSIDFSLVKAALATVVHIEGSSYRRTGARMLILDDGTYLGGISGGCLEGDALRRAQHAIIQNKPVVVRYDTTQDDGYQIGVGLGCNGIIDVLINPLAHNKEDNLVLQLSKISNTREPRALVTVIGDKKNSALGKTLLYENDNQFLQSFAINDCNNAVLNDLKNCLQKNVSQTISYPSKEGETKIFIEVIPPPIQLIIYGGGYDIYPLLRMAKELGWHTTVVTTIAKAKKLLFETANKLVDNKEGEQLPTDKYTAILLMSHDYETDFINLQKLANSGASYIGLLGPRKRSLKMFDALEQQGKSISEENKNRIFSPAGLEIGAKTPEEIALSILAEIQSHFAGKEAMPLRMKQGTIHDN